MKQKLSILSSFISILFLFSSCVFTGPSIRGNGDVEHETRNVGEFDAIKVSRGMNVYITQGDQMKVEIRADENLLDAIETIVDDDVLVIRATKNIRSATSKKVFVTVQDINSVQSSSGSNVYSETVLNSKNLKLSGSSGSNMKLEVNSEWLEATVSSGSNITLKGTADSFNGKASSGSNLKAEDLRSNSCSAKVSSGANIWISVKNTMQGDASSGGNIFYYGNPETTDIEKSSGGNVIKK